MAKRTFYESRLTLIESDVWIPHAGHPERRAERHYYLGALFVDDITTIIRVVEPDEVLILRQRIGNHNAAIAGGNHGDEELGLAQVDAERKRAAMQRGGPSALFNPKTQEAQG
jgi:hypothetical protein